MSLANPLSGAPRIQGELLKLGVDIGQTSVAKYMARRRKPPSQGWKTFLRNHADGIASIDLFLVPTLSFRLLYGLLILRHDRRQMLWLGVTGAQPPNGSTSNSLKPATGKPRRNISFAIATASMVRYSNSDFAAMVIRDRPTASHSPWQKAHTERLIGSIRREFLDHVVVFGEQHLRQILLLYMDYYNGARTHLALNKGASLSRAIQPDRRILPMPILGGLHHQYVRI